MEDKLIGRLRRIRASLNNIDDGDFSHARWSTSVESTPNGPMGKINMCFGPSMSQDEIDNAAFTLVSNIASLKDHLKQYCDQRGKPFEGDNLIDTNRDVGIVHDLWNIDKHAKLNRPK